MIRILFMVVLFTIFMVACGGDEMQETIQSTQFIHHKLKDVPGSAWKNVSNKKVYFGHQSVGFNIIDGIKDIMKENPEVDINIVATKDLGGVQRGIFAHSEVGHNAVPDSKLDDFEKIVENGVGNQADFAFMKFCYVDITKDTNVEEVFNKYKTTYDRLRKEFPKTTFIHVTTPITSKRSDLKTIAKNIVKKIIGRPVRTYKDNIERNRFNELLLKEYEGKAPIFDLAKVESTYPDGKMITYKGASNVFPTMVPSYTYDGGHLSEKGRKIVAEQFLVFLAKLAEEKQ